MSEGTATFPGEVDVTWSMGTARSECCKAIDGVTVRKRVLSVNVIDNGVDPMTAEDVAKLALYDATDPEDLTLDGAWEVITELPAGTAALQYIGFGGASYNYQAHNFGAAGVGNYEIHRGKGVFKVGWTAVPAWRAIDGPTARLEYRLALIPCYSWGVPSGSPTYTDVALDLAASPGTEDFEDPDWQPLLEPANGYLRDVDPGDAYSTQECLGD